MYQVCKRQMCEDERKKGRQEDKGSEGKCIREAGVGVYKGVLGVCRAGVGCVWAGVWGVQVCVGGVQVCVGGVQVWDVGLVHPGCPP